MDIVNNRNITLQTASFIEALVEIVKVDNSLLSGFNTMYGEGTGKGEGSDMYQRSGLLHLVEDLKLAIKKQVGDSMEISLGESLNREL